jgi:hypothetical protein
MGDESVMACEMKDLRLNPNGNTGVDLAFTSMKLRNIGYLWGFSVGRSQGFQVRKFRLKRDVRYGKDGMHLGGNNK